MSDNVFEREPAMRPLSRDHGVLLVLTQRLRKAAAGTEQDRLRLAGEIRDRFAGLVAEYLADETDAFSSVKFSRFVYNEIVSDHAKIARAVKRLAGPSTTKPTPGRFNALADLIEQHVRWDERMVLPYLQQELSGNDLAALAGRTSAIEGRHIRPIKRLHRSIKLDKQAGEAQTCTCADSLENTQ